MSGGGGVVRRMVAGALALSCLVVTVACEPPTRAAEPPIQTRSGGYTLGVLTTDGSPLYRVSTSGRVLTVSAPGPRARTVLQEPGNLRMAIVKDTTPVSVDHQSCVTWGAPQGPWDQPGVTLRVRSDPTRTRAIMVTNNVVFGARGTFNVHLTDSAADPPFRQVAGFTFPRAMTTASGALAPYPWRLCARTTGPKVEVKVWSLASRQDDPAWGDPAHSASVTVPASWVVAGRPGLYAGHLAAGSTMALTDPTAAAASNGSTKPWP